MRNSLSPGFLKIFYTTNGHPHIMTLPVNPVAPAGNATQLTDSSGAPQLWTSVVADIVLFMKALIRAADSIDTAEIWTQATPTSVPIFQASTTVGVAGTNGGTVVPYSQTRFSFRTALGGKAVWQLMETPFAIDQKFSAPLYGGVGAFAAVDSYFTGASAAVWGRDNAYIAVGVRAVTKINDTLRKKYLNP
jgi:hypothetical protein